MRKDNVWHNRSSTYIETTNPNGYDVLINGTNKYLNFNLLSGSTGYGIRDNNGTIEVKSSGGSWAAIGGGGGSGDMVLANAQTNSGVKTFLDATLGLRNVANSITSFFTNTSTVARTYTLQNRNGTLSDDTDLALKANLASPTFTGTVTIPTGASITTPVLTGLPTGSGLASAATASTLASRDANGNISADSVLQGYTTTVTAAGTTTLTVNDTYLQFFTGSTTQTLTLPVASTLVLGQQFYIRNNSTGAVTINSSGANVVRILAGNTRAIVTCILTSGTTAASWSVMYVGISIADGKILTASNTLTLAGTDATTMTFPATSATIARTDAAQSFTGVQTFVAPILGTPTSATLTNATGLPISGLVNSTSLALGVGSIELGHNSDTTLSRSAAGVMAVEGVVIPSVSSTNTFTNKAITRRVGTATSSATPTINTDNFDEYGLTAQTADITSFSTNLTGTPTDGQTLIVRVKGTATRLITWGASFAGGDVALPPTTSGTKTLVAGFKIIGSVSTTVWQCMASTNVGT